MRIQHSMTLPPGFISNRPTQCPFEKVDCPMEDGHGPWGPEYLKDSFQQNKRCLKRALHNDAQKLEEVHNEFMYKKCCANVDCHTNAFGSYTHLQEGTNRVLLYFPDKNFAEIEKLFDVATTHDLLLDQIILIQKNKKYVSSSHYERSALALRGHCALIGNYQLKFIPYCIDCFKKQLKPSVLAEPNTIYDMMDYSLSCYSDGLRQIQPGGIPWSKPIMFVNF